MTVEIGTYRGPPNSIHKTLNLSGFTGYVRGATNISNPTVQIETSLNPAINYMRIPEFGRSYFITGMSTVVNGLITVTGTVDVAESFKNDFLEWNCVVRRNENRYNMMLDDGIFKAYQNPKHKVIAFPRGMEDFSFILALGGNS